MLEQVATTITSLVEARNQLALTLSTLEGSLYTNSPISRLLQNQLREIDFSIRSLEELHKGIFNDEKAAKLLEKLMY